MCAQQFVWDDPFLLEDQFSEEERMIRDTAREYAQEKLFTRVLSANREERFDREIMNEFGELGMLGRHAAGEVRLRGGQLCRLRHHGREVSGSIPAIARQ